MIFDDLSTNLGHPAYSVQLTQPASSYVEASIEPWSQEDKFHSRGLSKKGERARAPEGVVGFQPRRKSVDERIEEMKKKYSKESIRVENYLEPGTPNSRQMYREKLNWLEKGQEFKQIGSERVIEEDMEEKEAELSQIEPHKFTSGMHSYYLMHKNSKPIKEASPNRIFEYKCNQNFQRMLRIKEKIRKKHTVAVSKQKQKYSEQQHQSAHPFSQRQRDSSNQLSTKAIFERNKLKIKMRGLSRQKMTHMDKELTKMEVVGTCSNARDYPVKIESMNLTSYSTWHTEKEKPGQRSQGKRQLSR